VTQNAKFYVKYFIPAQVDVNFVTAAMLAAYESNGIEFSL